MQMNPELRARRSSGSERHSCRQFRNFDRSKDGDLVADPETDQADVGAFPARYRAAYSLVARVSADPPGRQRHCADAFVQRQVWQPQCTLIGRDQVDVAARWGERPPRGMTLEYPILPWWPRNDPRPPIAPESSRDPLATDLGNVIAVGLSLPRRIRSTT